MDYDTLFANPTGRTSRGTFALALIPLLVVAAFYFLEVRNRTGDYCLLVLLFPAVMLHARRIRDMGVSPWILVAPAAIIVAAFWQHIVDPKGQPAQLLTWTGLALSAAFLLWGLAGKSKAP